MRAAERLRRLDERVLTPPARRVVDPCAGRRWRRQALLALPAMVLVIWLAPGAEWDVAAIAVGTLLAGPYVELLVARGFRRRRR